MKNPCLSLTRPSCRHRSGFSLVEIITVIAIISVLMTAGAIGLGNLTAGKGTSTAIATCESLFEEARMIAVSKRCKARVIVDVDNPTSETYLRRVAIVHEQVDNQGVVVPSGNWVLASRAYIMPTGTFFSQTYSQAADGTAIPEDTLTSGVTTSYQGNWAYYEFNGEGICSSPGARFIIGAGARAPGGEPKITKAAEKDFAGLVIWRNGRTSSYRSPEQMNITSESGDNF